jgi:hypothetical protein
MAIDVANQTDWNTAVAAVAAAGASSTVSINITGGFTLSSSLAQLQASNANVTVNITGNSQTINGASSFQGIVVSGANAPTVSISSLSISNTVALGGNGQNGQNGYYSGGLSYGSGGGGGGGLGAGGGLLVGSGANVTLAAVTFTGNTATGGAGGNGGSAQNTAADPVNGGNGGAGGAANNGGTSGGGGAGGTGGHAGGQGTTGTDANDAFLNLAMNTSSASINQQNVSNALANSFNLMGGIPAVFTGLTPAGLTQISGETSTGAQQTTFNAMSQFMGVMTDPFIAGRGDSGSAPTGAIGYAEESLAYARKRNPSDALAAIYNKAPPAPVFVPGWSVWAAGFGGSQQTDGNTALGSNDTTSSVYGTAVGADYRFSPFTIAGFSLAGGGTTFNVTNGGSGRSAVPGRRLRQAQCRRGLCFRRAGLWLAERHHQPHRDGGRCRSVARTSTPTPTPAGSKAAIALSRHGRPSASRPMPPGSSQPSICRPMPKASSPAPTRSSSATDPRVSPIHAASSACAPTDRLR